MRTSLLRKVNQSCIVVTQRCLAIVTVGGPKGSHAGRNQSVGKARPPYPQSKPPPYHTSADTTMAREQPSVGDLLPLLETSDLHQLDEIRGIINEQLSAGTTYLIS